MKSFVRLRGSHYPGDLREVMQTLPSKISLQTFLHLLQQMLGMP